MRHYLHRFFIASVLFSLIVTSIFPPQAVSASPLQAPTITFTMTDILIDDGAGPISPDEDGDGEADPGETIEYTAVITNSGADPATGVTFNDILDLNTTLVGGSLNVSPLALDDSYTTIGNTLLDVGVSTSDPAVHVTTGLIDSLFDNDTEFLGDSFTLKSVESDTAAPFTTATEQGGTVTVESDGNFSYLPAVGFSGTDHFDYVITDDGPDNIPGNADDLTGAGRVTITVTPERVWYVKNDAAPGGSGRSTDPFDTLAEAQAASTDDDTIYVFQGNGTTTGQNAGITLKNGQRLLGEGVALTVPVSVNGGPNPTILRAAGSQPLIDNTGGFGVSVPEISNVQIFGLNLAGSTNAVNVTTTAANSGSFELANNTIRSAGANGIDVNGGGSGTLTVSLHDNIVTATGNGIDIQRTAGSVNVIAFDDNVVHGNTAGIGINIVGTVATILFDANPATAAFDTVSGGTTLIGQSGNGVGQSGLILNNIRGDLNFTDLDVYVDNGTALLVNGTSPNYTGTSGTRLVANSNMPVLSATGGPAANLTDVSVNLVLNSLSSANSTTTGVSLLRVGGTFSAPSGSSITNAAGVDFSINGSSNASANVGVSYAGTITDTSGMLVQIQNVTASSTHTFSGAITDSGGTSTGVLLTGNTGATITFSGGMTLSTGSNAAFAATGGGTVNVCDDNPCNPGATGSVVNTLTTTTGTALNIANTAIGSNNLEFRSISSNGAVSGIVLDTTGSSGRLIVKGNGGTCSSALTCTGGAIQNSTSHGISLTSTTSPSFTRIAIQNAARSGMDGQQVTNFTLDNSFIDNVGTGAAGQYEESNIAFNDGGLFTNSNISGTVSITNNILTNARRHGIQIENGTGTISNLTISNNILTSSTDSTISLGTAILTLIQGSASTTAHLTTGTISGNTITNFPSGEGIAILGGSGNGSNNTSATLGANGTPINITNNTISGQPAATSHLGSNAIRASMNSQVGVMNFNISCNGNTTAGCSATGPITNIQGQGISVFAGGTITGTTTVNNNVIVANQTLGAGTQGLAVQVDDGPSGLNTSAADYNFIITNNNVTNYEGTGIRAIVRVSLGKMDVTIQNNIVGTPILANRNGIRVDAGLSAPGDTTLCLNISGNTSDGSGVNAGIGIRKQGTNATVHEFGIVGLSPSPTTGANAAAKINTDNPAGGSVDVLSGDNFVNCATTAMLPDNNQVVAQDQLETKPAVLASAASTNLNYANTFTAAFASWKLSEQVSENNLPNPVVNASTGSGGKPLFTIRPIPAQSGETVGPITIGTLPVGKSVTIQFRVTVNDPVSTSRILNQGNVTYTGGPGGGVNTTDPSPNADPACSGTGTQTCTPTDRPDTTVVSINRNVPLLSTFNDQTNATSVTWRVTFGSAISSLGTSNFTLLSGGTLTGTSITSVTALGGAPATEWDVLVNTGNGDGLLELNMTSDAGISHDISNLSFTTGEDYTIDKTAPTTTSFTRQNPSTTPTSADVLVFRVTFNEAIGGTGGLIGAEDFVVTGTTATVTTVSFVSTGIYDLEVSGGDLANFNGMVGLDFSASMVIRDLAGNNVANTEPTTDETYTVDNAQPSVTLSSVSSDPTNANPIPVTVQFSENVSGFSATDIVAGNATVSNFNAVDGDTYTFDLAPGGQGFVTADIAAGIATDSVGNGNAAATQFSRTFDSDAPTVAITSAASNPTNTSPISVTVQFSENMTGFAASDITPGNATVGNFIAVDGDTYTFDLTPSSQGVVTVDIAAGAAQDGSGNGNSAASQFSRTYDSAAPTLTMTSAAPDPTNTSPISVSVQFSESVTGFDTGDITAGNATVGNFNVVDGDTFTFDLTPLGTGLITADIAAGLVADTAGNANSAAVQFSRTFDSDTPTVTMSSAAFDPTNSSPIPVTVQFSENVTGFNASDITPSNATIENFVIVDSDTYTFDLTPLSDGLVTADIPAGVVQDSSTNGNSAASQFSRTFDTLAPSVTINQAAGQADPTGAGSINFTVIFSESVTGFATGDVTLSGTASPATAVVTGSGSTYAVAVSGMTSSGTVIASIPAGIAQDGATNLNAASTSIDKTVSYILDNTSPVVVSILRADPNPTSAVSVNFTVTFSEPVTGVDAGDFNLTTSGISSASISAVNGSSNVYTVTVNTGSNNGSIRLNVINNSTIKDAALNSLAAGFINGETYTIVNKSAIFADVPSTYWASSFIDRIYNAGITSGCSVNPLTYCPDSKVTRAQMAVFILRAVHGSSYVPPGATGTIFNDVPVTYWAAAWIEQFYTEGFTGGCGNGNYCPDEVLTTRAQMAIFLLRGKYGSSYMPPAPSGIFNDVPVTYWAAPWIEQLYAEGITGGCGNGNYCPEASLTRAEMAVFLVRTFNLP